MKFTLALATGFLLLAAASCAPRLHPWQTPGDHFELNVPLREWELLDQRRFFRVLEEKRPESLNLLDKETFVPLSEEQARAFTGKELPPAGEAMLTPYLVRGVSYSPTPWALAMRLDKKSGLLVTFQGTYDGENLLTYMVRREPRKSPLVVYLESPPTYVFATAALGGDALLRTVPLREK